MEKVIIAQVSVKGNKVKKFLKLARNIVNESLTESGCLIYRLSRDLNEKNEFVFYEKYVNKKAVEHHYLSDHFKCFLNSVMPLLIKEPYIENFDV
ncbi:putative quinol monooxygenase [Hyunsoonleella ulvae]|uniref:putative quinol monooxygenase n=1 Tax=Hyunsoonleella ulvae TaxID=2799948 RepID=UPI001939F589|nr:putative quinol monooxygenase [Hyunsoonleella ulvae]